MENTIEIEESKGKNKGFTLVELLIVIVILGILAAVTVFAVRGITDKAETNACSVDKKNYETAIEAYFAVNNGYPAIVAAVTADATVDPPIVGHPAQAAGLVPEFVKSLPENWSYTKPVGSDYELVAVPGSPCA